MLSPSLQHRPDVSFSSLIATSDPSHIAKAESEREAARVAVFVARALILRGSALVRHPSVQLARSSSYRLCSVCAQAGSVNRPLKRPPPRRRQSTPPRLDPSIVVDKHALARFTRPTDAP